MGQKQREREGKNGDGKKRMRKVDRDNNFPFFIFALIIFYLLFGAPVPKRWLPLFPFFLLSYPSLSFSEI